MIRFGLGLDWVWARFGLGLHYVLIRFGRGLERVLTEFGHSLNSRSGCDGREMGSVGMSFDGKTQVFVCCIQRFNVVAVLTTAATRGHQRELNI